MNDTLTSIFRDQWRVVLIVGLMLLTLTEVGFRVGMRLFVCKDEPRKGQLGNIQGAVLGMLALLLGFTFSMSVSRFDIRRDLVLEEANSIGTTYLRASLLPEAHQTAVQTKLRRYVDQRLAFGDAGTDATRLAAVEKETAVLHGGLWEHAVAAAKEAPTPITSTFIVSLNDTIDLSASRLHALRSRVPGAVWMLVLVVAGMSCYTCGYNAGSSGARTTLANLLMPLLIAVVLTLISDFDRPHKGLVVISQQPMLDLKASISTP